MSKALDEYSLTEFREMENFAPQKRFTDVIIVPMDDIHDSGFRCMKYILVKRGEIVGVVGGGCDVAHINGIGGYGPYGKDFEEALKTQRSKRVAWSIDCLPKSRCIRLFADHDCITDDFIGSDFSFYPINPAK